MDGKDKQVDKTQKMELHVRAMIFASIFLLLMYFLGGDNWPLVMCAFCLAYLVGRKAMGEK